jgi:hypothetical protein
MMLGHGEWNVNRAGCVRVMLSLGMTRWVREHWRSVYIDTGQWGLGSMDTRKKRAPWVPALVEPPDPLAPLNEWQSYRAGLDRWKPGCSSVVRIWTGWMGYARSRLRLMP